MLGLAESRPGPSTIASQTIASQWRQAMIGASAARPSPPIGSGWYRRPRPGHVIRQARDGSGLPDRHRGAPAARRPGAQGAAADLAGTREREFVHELDDPQPAIGDYVGVSRFIGDT